jgi:hypothetical protein
MAYKMIFRPEDIEFHLLDDLTSGPVVTVEIVTPAGVLLAMAEPEEEGHALLLRRFHMHAAAGANAIGPGNLRRIAEVVMERMDYHELIVEGAVRTSGANPGHRPRQRFTRRLVVAPVSQP